MIFCGCDTDKIFLFVTKDNFLKMIDLENHENSKICYAPSQLKLEEHSHAQSVGMKKPDCDSFQLKLEEHSHDIIPSIVKIIYVSDKKIMATTYDSQVMIFDIGDFTCEKFAPDIISNHAHINIVKKYIYANLMAVFILGGPKYLYISHGTNMVKQIAIDLDDDETIHDIEICGIFLFILTTEKLIINSFYLETHRYTLQKLKIIHNKYDDVMYYMEYYFLLNNGIIDIYDMKYEKQYSMANEIYICDMKLVHGKIFMLGKINQEFAFYCCRTDEINNDDIQIILSNKKFYLHLLYYLDQEPKKWDMSCRHYRNCDCVLKYILHTDNNTFLEFIQYDTDVRSRFIIDYEIKKIITINCMNFVIITNQHLLKYYTVSLDMNHKLTITHIKDDEDLVKDLSGIHVKKALSVHF